MNGVVAAPSTPENEALSQRKGVSAQPEDSIEDEIDREGDQAVRDQQVLTMH